MKVLIILIVFLNISLSNSYGLFPSDLDLSTSQLQAVAKPKCRKNLDKNETIEEKVTVKLTVPHQSDVSKSEKCGRRFVLIVDSVFDSEIQRGAITVTYDYETSKKHFTQKIPEDCEYKGGPMREKKFICVLKEIDPKE